MSTSAGMRSLAITFPGGLKTNDYWRRHYPQMFGGAVEKRNVWAAPEGPRDEPEPAGEVGSLTLVGDSLNVGTDPYLRDELEGWTIDAHAPAQWLPLVAARYVDNHHRVTQHYPLNPNGSPLGMTALTTTTGRVTIMMPHPERVFRTVAMSWHPAEWGEDSPWMRLFRNARVWVG